MNFEAKQSWVWSVWLCPCSTSPHPLVPLCKEENSVNISGFPWLMRPHVHSILAYITHLWVLLLFLYLKGKVCAKGNLQCAMLPSPKLLGHKPQVWHLRFIPWAWLLKDQNLFYWTVHGLRETLYGFLQNVLDSMPKILKGSY